MSNVFTTRMGKPTVIFDLNKKDLIEFRLTLHNQNMTELGLLKLGLN